MYDVPRVLYSYGLYSYGLCVCPLLRGSNSYELCSYGLCVWYHLPGGYTVMADIVVAYIVMVYVLVPSPW